MNKKGFMISLKQQFTKEDLFSSLKTAGISAGILISLALIEYFLKLDYGIYTAIIASILIGLRETIRKYNIKTTYKD